MSAFVVSTEHVDALLKTAMHGPKGGGWRVIGHDHSWFHEGEWHTLKLNSADQVGQMLMDENITSVSHRYPNDDLGELPGSYVTEAPAEGIEPVRMAQWLVSHRYDSFKARHLTAVEALKAISCYEYQSCEHPGWADSQAKAFCDSLKDSLIGELPGYSEADWEVHA